MPKERATQQAPNHEVSSPIRGYFLHAGVVLPFLCFGIAVFTLSSTLGKILKERRTIHSLFAGLVPAGDQCHVGKTSLVFDNTRQDFSTWMSGLSLKPSVLPYRRMGSEVFKMGGLRVGESFVVSCSIETKSFRKDKDLFLNWGPFGGSATAYVNGTYLESWSDKDASNFVMVIPSSWHNAKDFITVSFVTTPAVAPTLPFPGPSSLVPIYATQDISRLESLAVETKTLPLKASSLMLGSLGAILLMLALIWIFGAGFPDIRWMTLSLTASLLATHISLEWTSSTGIVVVLRKVLFDASIASLTITAFYFFRSERRRWFPYFVMALFCALELMYHVFEVRLGWAYISSTLYALMGVVGLVYFVESLGSNGPRRGLKICVALLLLLVGFFEAPHEAKMSYTGVFYGDMIQLLLSWGMASVISAESVQNLMRSQVLLKMKDVETKRRIQAEQNTEISLALHGMFDLRSVADAPSNFSFAVSRSHKITLSGDWMCTLTGRDGSSVAVFGDIYGGGLGASLAASALLGYVSSQSDQVDKASSFLKHLNIATRRMFRGDVMSSAVVIRMRTDGLCELYNAGHAGVMIAREDGSIEFVKALMPPLGAMVDFEVKGIEFNLHSDDRIIAVNSGGAKGARGLRAISKMIRDLSETENLSVVCDEVCKSLEIIDPDDDHVVACFRRAS